VGGALLGQGRWGVRIWVVLGGWSREALDMLERRTPVVRTGEMTTVNRDPYQDPYQDPSAMDKITDQIIDRITDWIIDPELTAMTTGFGWS